MSTSKDDVAYLAQRSFIREDKDEPQVGETTKDIKDENTDFNSRSFECMSFKSEQNQQQQQKDIWEKTVFKNLSLVLW